jgi:hypothetical protein
MLCLGYRAIAKQVPLASEGVLPAQYQCIGNKQRV